MASVIPKEVKKEFIDRWHDEDGGKKVKNFGIILWKGKRYFDDRIAVKMK